MCVLCVWCVCVCGVCGVCVEGRGVCVSVHTFVHMGIVRVCPCVSLSISLDLS